MSGASHRRLPVVLALAALFFSGCADRTEHAVEAPPSRPSDGVLEDPDLQSIVDLQVAGDMYGLVDALGHERPEMRARAAFALGSLAAVESVDALLPLLQDPENSVRRDAAFALGRIGDAGEVGAVALALETERDSDAREALIEALGMLPSEAAAEALLAADLSDPENVSRVYALARLGASGAVASDSLRGRMVADLTAENPLVREAASHYFGSPNNVGRWASRALFLRMALDSYDKGDPAAMRLVRGLSRIDDVLNASRLRQWATEATDWRTRANAMSGMDPMSASAPILLDALDDPDVNVAVAAAERLTKDALPGGMVSPLEEWIARSDGRRLGVAAPLLVGLAQLERTAAVMSWVGAIPPGDELRWHVGFGALSFLPGEEAIRGLAVGLSDPSEGVPIKAFRALEARWDADRQTPETHDLYYSVFSAAASHRLAEVRAEARRVLASAEFSGRAESGDGVPEDDPLTAAPEAAAGPDGPPQSIDWGSLAELGRNPVLELETSRGLISIRMLPEEAPLTVQTVAWLVDEGQYDGVPFHRVVPNFVVQAGDYMERDGSGEPGFSTRVELTSVPFLRGVVGMANTGSREGQGSQFMITHSRQLELDGAFTAFGWVERGLDVLDRIELFDVVEHARVVSGLRN